MKKIILFLMLFIMTPVVLFGQEQKVCSFDMFLNQATEKITISGCETGTYIISVYNDEKLVFNTKEIGVTKGGKMIIDASRLEAGNYYIQVVPQQIENFLPWYPTKRLIKK